MRRNLTFIGLMVLMVVVGLGLGILSGGQSSSQVAMAQAPADEQAQIQTDMAHLKQIGAGLIKYGQEHKGELPANIRTLYPDYVDSEDVFFSPRDPKAAALRDTPVDAAGRPGYTSYVYQHILGETEDARRQREAFGIPAPKLFSRLVRERGDQFPIVVCSWYLDPSLPLTQPQLWLVLRLNGSVEQEVKGVKDSEDL